MQPKKIFKDNFSDKKLFPIKSINYRLIDCGNMRKLEEIDGLIVNRPESNASWPPSLSKKEWDQWDLFFFEERGKKGKWTIRNPKKKWNLQYKYRNLQLSFKLSLTSFKHIGIFPEQAENWKFIQDHLDRIKGEKKVLNLFAYTGAASIVAATCGAQVTNVDSVKQVLNWGRENALLNNQDAIRWILEDARKFVKKSLRRKDIYHGIIMDPPAFGFGANNEKWKLDRDLKELLQDVIQLLCKEQHFFVLNTYSPQLAMPELRSMLNQISLFPAQYEAAQLGLKSLHGQFLPLGNLIRFSK